MTTSPSTKQLIAKSLKQLLQTTPFNKITIQNIVDGCHINRQTFYYHFQDIYDALAWMFLEELNADLEEIQIPSGTGQRLLHLFEYILENRALCLNVLHSNAQDYLSRFMYDLVYRSVNHMLHEIGTGLMVKEEEYAFIANFYTAGLLNVLTQWLYGGLKEDPGKMVDRIMLLIDNAFEEVLKKYDSFHKKASL